jgi:hypothetical protein
MEELNNMKKKTICILENAQLYKNRNLAQAVLLMLEHELSGAKERTGGGSSFSGWDGSCTVEHILPQDPEKEGEDWMWPAGHEGCLHKLGNLCLLNQSDSKQQSQ